MENKTSDKIATTQASSGVVTIESINYITTNSEKQTFQILETQNDSIQLAIGDALASQVVEDISSGRRQTF